MKEIFYKCPETNEDYYNLSLCEGKSFGKGCKYLRFCEEYKKQKEGSINL